MDGIAHIFRMEKNKKEKKYSARDIQKLLRPLADKKTAAVTRAFFKTGKGEYGEKDKFLGVRVPLLRKLVKRCKEIELNEISKLIKSHFHEERMFALFLFIEKFRDGGEKTRQKIYNIYLKQKEYINSWDLVDSSAPFIIGEYLVDRGRGDLYRLAQSKNFWHRRIAIVATLRFIKNNEFKDALTISKRFIKDKEELIHKATGWMLREIGKRDFTAAKAFLDENYKKMPRIMLRYAIERFAPKERNFYMNKEG